jgi:hypothetical protein
MKAYMLMTSSGPIVILTSHASVLDDTLIAKLAEKDIDKFIACEVPIALAEQRYGTHFAIVKGGLRETDDLRVLDEDGDRLFKLFRFDELGPAIMYERPSGAPVPDRRPITSTSPIEYRGYALTAVHHAPGWRIHIYPGPRLLHTQPDHVLAPTREEAFAEARAVIDRHLLG